MPLPNNPVIKHKVGLLNLAEEHGNVPKVCKVDFPKTLCIFCLNQEAGPKSPAGNTSSPRPIATVCLRLKNGMLDLLPSG